jgi:hypothetical protein
MIAIALAIILSIPFVTKSQLRDLRREKIRRKKWRKQRGLLLSPKPDGDPPMPFHVARSLSYGGVPYAGISTEASDNFRSVIHSAFAPRKIRD